MNERMKKIIFVVNPISGTQSKELILSLLNEKIDKARYSWEVVYTERAGHAVEIAAKAAEEKADIVVAIGGDGTINEIARSLVHTDTALGIIPCGSGNGLARHLHIPMEPKKALEVLNEGCMDVIDYGKINGTDFFCTCGVGFDAAVSQKFAGEKRRGSLTYIKNTVEEYLSYKPEPYELLIDNQTVKEKAFLVACGNASQYGNNAFIAPHANIQDGKMDITILSPFGPLDIAPLAIQLFTKQIDRNSKIKTFKGKEVTIIRQNPGVMHLDGEPIMADSRIEISVLPKSLNVLTPETVSFTEEVQNLFGEVTRFFDKKLPYIFR
jgi:diacylglycerol kinase (ATP)